MEKMLNQLVGGKITAIGIDNSEEAIADFGEPVYCLVVTMPNGRVKHAYIMQDAEGNGAGFLDVQSA